MRIRILIAVLVLSVLTPPVLAAEDTPAPDADKKPDPNVVVYHGQKSKNWWDAPKFLAPISLVVEKADLNAVIPALAKASGLNLVVSGGSKATKKVTLNLRNAPLRDVMAALSGLYDLVWFEQGNVYVLTYISKAKKTTSAPDSGPTYQHFEKPSLPPLPKLGNSVIITPEGAKMAKPGTIPNSTKPRVTKPKVYQYTPAPK